MKPNRLLFILFFLFIYKMLFPQETFNYLYKNEEDNRPGNIIETKDKEYIFYLNTYHNTICSYSTLVKLNSRGEFIQSNTISENSDIYSIALLHLIRNSDSTFLCIGNSFNKITLDTSCLVIMCLDNDLNTLYRHDHGKITRFLGYVRHNRKKNGNIILTTNLDSLVSGYPITRDILLYEITPTGDSLKAKYYYNNYWQEPYQMIEKPDQTGYYLWGNTQLIDPLPGNIFITELDYDFEPVAEFEDPYWIEIFYTNVKPFGNSQIIYTGKDNLPGEQYIDAIAILDSELNPIRKQQIIAPDSLNASTRYNSSHKTNLDFIDKNNIYVTGASNLTLDVPYQREPSWIMITNFDSLLNIRWQKYFGGDAFYMSFNTLATSDGGCIVMGFRWDKDVNEEDTDIFVVKADSLGNLTSIQTFPINADNLKLYPNPGTNAMHIEIPGELYYTNNEIYLHIYDLSGKLLYQNKTENKLLNINTEQFKPGLYFVQLIENGRILSSEKWIKR